MQDIELAANSQRISERVYNLVAVSEPADVRVGEAACIRHDEVDDEIEFDALLDRNIGAARFTASASNGSCRSICSNLSFRYTQVLNRDIGDDNR